MALRDEITEDKFLEMYHGKGMKFYQIAHHFGKSKTSVTKLAQEYGIKAKRDWQSNAKDFSKDFLYELYITNKKSAKQIGMEIGVSANSVNYMLDKYDITRRGKQESVELSFAQKLNIDIESFRNDSCEKFYIIGLIASDGCVSQNSVSITSKDKEMLDFVANFIKLKLPIKENTSMLNGNEYRHYRLGFSSVEVVTILNYYGITERKSLTLSMENIPQEYISDFIRGVFDGDGTLSVLRRRDNNARTQKFSIVTGSEDFAKNIYGILSNTLGVSVNKISKDKRGNGLYTVSVGKRKDVVKIGKWFYGEKYDKYGLSRKKDKFRIVNEWALSS